MSAPRLAEAEDNTGSKLVRDLSPPSGKSSEWKLISRIESDLVGVVRHARQEEIRIFPIFSRYLFINFNADAEGLSQVRATDGIIDVITNNWQPVEISDEVIEEIKTRETSGAFNQKPPPHLHKQKWSKSFDTLKKLLEPCA